MNGKSLPTPEMREDRIASALESIAASLEKIAAPWRMVRPDGTVAAVEEGLNIAGYRVIRESEYQRLIADDQKVE